MNHTFDLTIATKFGVNIAIFLQNMAFWTHINQANKRNFHDGRYWTFNSQEALTELFPYWSRQNLRTVVLNCIKTGLLIEGNYNKIKFDQTKWYALTDLGLSLFPHLTPSLCIGENQPVEWSEPTNGVVGTNQPIPDTLPDNLKDKDKHIGTRVIFNVSDMLEENPHGIEHELLEEWIQQRKKFPLTKTAWNRANNVMAQLAAKGIAPQDAFERMLSNHWRNMEVNYFDQEVNKKPVREEIDVHSRSWLTGRPDVNNGLDFKDFIDHV